MITMTFDEMPEMLKVKEIKKFLRIGRKQAYELVKSDDFNHIRINQTIRVPKKDFKDWFERKLTEKDGSNHTQDSHPKEGVQK